MSELRKKVEMEVHHHISPLIGWLRNDAAKGKVDTDGTRHDQWKERADLAVDAIMEHVGEVEYEYNIECLDLVTGHTSLWRTSWEPNTDWLQKKLDGRKEYDQKLLNVPNGGPLEYSYRLVKRRKAGRIENV